MPKWLWTLLAVAFVFYTDDYVIAGVLTDIADSFGIPSAKAGQLVTVFSVTVAISAPVASFLFRNIPRRKLFTYSLTIFAVTNLLAAFSGSYWILFILRIIGALCAGVTTPTIFSWTTEKAPDGKVGKYVSIVTLGVTGSMLVGVPVGTLVAVKFGWQSNFIILAILAAALVLLLNLTMREDNSKQESISIAEKLQSLNNRPTIMVLIVNIIFMSGSMMAYTYTLPYLEFFDDKTYLRTLAFLLSGITGIFGIWFGGLITDKKVLINQFY